MTATCECGGRKKPSARRCRRCHDERGHGGLLTDAVLASYGAETPEQIAARLGTSVMAVYNTASRLRQRHGPVVVPYLSTVRR